MKELRLKILLLSLNIVKELLLAIIKSVLITFLVIIEAAAKFSQVGLMICLIDKKNPVDQELEAMSLYKSVGKNIDHIRELIEQIKDIKENIQELRKQEKAINETKEEPVIEEEKQLETVNVQDSFNQDILEYIKVLIEKCKELNHDEQSIFILKLKAVLQEYTTEYVESLEKIANSNIAIDNYDISISKETTIQKLKVIEDAINERIKYQEQSTNITIEQPSQTLPASQEETLPSNGQALKY